jgi:DHA3 family macrolide efflux protein-like MFS transporter
MESTKTNSILKSRRPTLDGARAFMMVWLGQMISFIGSGLTSFALGVWVFQKTGDITQYALISMFFVLPGVLLGPLAGTLVDRWDRRKAMFISDLGAGLSTLSIAVVYLLGGLQVWYIYLAVFMNGAFGSLRMPSMQAAMTLMIPKKNLGRTSGMMEIVQIGEYLIAPTVAGGLMGSIGLAGIVMIDFSTFLVAISILLFVRIPRATATGEGRAGQGTVLQEAVYGWKYIMARPGLAALMVLFAFTNFTTEMTVVLFTPLILSFASTAKLGLAMSLCSSGFLVGGLLMSIWGGPKRRVPVMMTLMILLGVFSAMIGLRASVGLIVVSGFLATLTVPIISSSNQVIWQKKVAADVQGRVFAIRRTITLATPLVTYAIAGPLSDRVFEPLMAVNGALSGSFGQFLGMGPGRGIGLLFVCMGLLLTLVTAIGCFSPRLRKVEEELPDAVTAQLARVKTDKKLPSLLPARRPRTGIVLAQGHGAKTSAS